MPETLYEKGLTCLLLVCFVPFLLLRLIFLLLAELYQEGQIRLQQLVQHKTDS